MSKHKLLLADDSITIQKVVNLTFADEGIEVISVSDGDSALEKIQQESPDLVLADVNMPGMSGYQICEKIKQSPETRTVPVILLVGSFEPFDEAEAHRVGADDYLTKPFQSIRQLVSKVSELLDAAANNQKSSPPEIAAPPLQEIRQEEPDNSFANTERFERAEVGAFNLGDAGFDDEMIQTNQIGSLPIDEEQKFIANQGSEKFGGIAAYQSNYVDYDAGNDFPLKDIAQESAPNNENSLTNSFFDSLEFNPTIYDFAGETPETNYKTAESQENSLLESNYSSSELAAATAQLPESKEYDSQNAHAGEFFDKNIQSSPVVEFDELDLLEVPPLPPETAGESEDKFDSPIADDFIERDENGAQIESAREEIAKPETLPRENKPPESQLQLPPETIEIIAQKVAERISDKAIREIAMELIPQLTEAIVKKMTKENTKK